MRACPWSILAALTTCLLAGSLSAQAAPWPRVYRLSTTDTAPVLDGALRESVWTRADSIVDFTQRDPDEGQPVSERTVLRFLAADAGLWVGIWA
ncbi:MAG: hypothetical protein H7066_23270, partial [Cytophagaceae bacterium]|nr:hypothetical protein [Gemmatimonadaceae bacterium]